MVLREIPEKYKIRQEKEPEDSPNERQEKERHRVGRMATRAS